MGHIDNTKLPQINITYVAKDLTSTHKYLRIVITKKIRSSWFYAITKG